jgi:hypothetical protein
MGRWMIELFSLKQLDAMEQKDYDLLRNIVLRELESSSQIRKILEKKVRPIYKTLTAKTNTRGTGKKRSSKKKRRAARRS